MRKSLLLLLSGQVCMAQPVLRHTRSFQGWELAAGITSTGPMASGAYSRYVGRSWYWKMAVGGERTEQQGVRYTSLAIMPALCWSIWQAGSTCYANLLVGVLGTYAKHEEIGRRHKASHFNVGLTLGTEIELFMTNHWVLLLCAAPAYYFLNDPYGPWAYSVGVGIKWTY